MGQHEKYTKVEFNILNIVYTMNIFGCAFFFLLVAFLIAHSHQQDTASRTIYGSCRGVTRLGDTYNKQIEIEEERGYHQLRPHPYLQLLPEGYTRGTGGAY